MSNYILFERNNHDHIVITFDGIDLTGAQEIQRLTAAGFRVSICAESYLTSMNADGYDKSHRLVAGQRYKVALMPTREIWRDSDRTTDALRKRGFERYGYKKPLAGIVPRIRESVSNQNMEDMEFWYIAAPHDTIEDSYSDPDVLQVNRFDSGLWLGAACGHPKSHWSGVGAFAFLLPAS